MLTRPRTRSLLLKSSDEHWIEHWQFGMAGSTVSTFLIWFVKISGNWEEAPQFCQPKALLWIHISSYSSQRNNYGVVVIVWMNIIPGPTPVSQPLSGAQRHTKGQSKGCQADTVSTLQHFHYQDLPLFWQFLTTKSKNSFILIREQLPLLRTYGKTFSPLTCSQRLSAK